jgi:xylulokinase
MPPGSRLSGLRDVLPEHMLVGQYTKSCAASVKWARNVFYSEIPSSNDAYSKMDQDAQLIPVGADGLTFHPYLTGENAPYFDSNLRAKFSGINIGHTRGHFARAVYEGVSFSILDVLNSFAVFQMATDIIFVGGGTKSKVWLQILSDVLGKAGTAAANGDASFGAALIAGEGAGVLSAAEAIKMNISQGKKITPTDSTYAYQQFFENYKQLAGK